MELLAVFVVGLLALAVLGAALAVIGLTIRALVWLVLLPLKIVFGLLILPFLLLKLLFGIAVGVVVLPVVGVIAVVGAVIGVVALGAMLLVPLLPLLVVALLIWAAVKLFSPVFA